nr:T9SS type A sorting domain-containing protein [Bacteroidota bacterium]
MNTFAKLTITAAFASVAWNINAQGCGIRYQYDQSGNRISRDWYCWTDDPDPDETKSLSNDPVQTEPLLESVFLTLFPNPASDLLTVQFSNPVPNGQVEILDTQGRRALSSSASGVEAVFNVKVLRPGNYFLSFQLNNERIVKAFMIER